MEPYAPQERLPQVRPDERVGDLERSHVCDQLSAAFAAGRLDHLELEDRIARAVAARTRLDLLLLVHDLGSPPPSQPVTRAAARPDWSLADLLAVLALIGCSLAVLAMLLVLAGVSPPYFLASVVGGTLAFVAGVSATHLVQRSARRSRERLHSRG